MERIAAVSFFLEGLAEFLDLGLKGALAVLFDAGRDVAVRGHVEVVGAGLGAGGEDRVVDLTGAGVDRDKDLLFLEEGGEGDRVGRVEFDDFEPAVVGLRRQSLGELGIHIAEIDLVETVVGMEALTNDGTDSSRPQHQGAFHGRNLLIISFLSILGGTLSYRQGVSHL